MGEVWLARGPDDVRPVVIKRVHPHLASQPSFRSQFFAEAGVVARLVHPNIVRILELGDAGGEAFVVLEFIDGLSLASLLEHTGPLPTPLACRIAADVAGALHLAHRARDERGRALGLVHRDVSPRNVMVDVDGVVKLLDFGLARSDGGGAVAYAAPEEVLDARSDQFSLGAVLWELLTGTPRFDGDDDATIVLQIAEGGPRSLGPGFPPALDALLARLLTREPADRFDDCAQVQRSLVEFAGRADALAAVVRPWVTSSSVASPDTPARGDAEARFVALARRVVRDFELTDEARAVLRQLDSPIALGLVAGRAPALPAQTSLEAIARWSWSSLSAHEQFALRQVLRWAPEFTLEHAEASLDLSGFPRAPWALDVVQALADRGWLETKDHPLGPRFSMPGPLRAIVEAW